MFDVTQRASISKLAKLLKLHNAESIAANIVLNGGAFVPTCPLNSSVYRFSPVDDRVLRYTIIDIHYNNEDVIYNAEAYEDGCMIAYAKFNEEEIGVRFYISRSAAQRNHNVLTEDDYQFVKKSVKKYANGQLSIVSKGNGVYNFKLDGKLVSLKSGLKRLSTMDPSNEMREFIERFKEADYGKQ